MEEGVYDLVLVTPSCTQTKEEDKFLISLQVNFWSSILKLNMKFL